MDNIIIFCAKYLVFVIPLLVIWLIFKQNKPKKLEMATTIALSGLLSLALSTIAGHLYSNPRPFVSDHSVPLISHGYDNGFPSEHTILAMTLTTILYFYSRRLAILGLALTLLVGWGRVAAHVHHSIDILGGLAVGIIAGCLGYWLAKKLVPGAQNRTADQKSDQPISGVDLK